MSKPAFRRKLSFPSSGSSKSSNRLAGVSDYMGSRRADLSSCKRHSRDSGVQVMIREGSCIVFMRGV
jgi:hypothetical protein